MNDKRGAALVSPILLSLTLLVWLPGASTTLVAHEPARFGSEPVVQASALLPAATPPTERVVGAPEYLYFRAPQAEATVAAQARLTSSALAVRSYRDAADRIRGQTAVDELSPLPMERLLAEQVDYTQTVAPAVALAQVDDIAASRGLDPERLRALVDWCTDKHLGLFGEPTVNLRMLNRALDDLDSRTGLRER